MSSTAPPFPVGSFRFQIDYPARPVIAARWRRFAAFALDTMLLGAVCGLIALPFSSLLSTVGIWGRMIGLLVTVPYFAIPESGVGRGQTIGKKLLGIRLVNRAGHAVQLETALLRATIFAIPSALNQLPLPASRLPMIEGVLLSVVIFGLGGASIYLMCANRTTGQGLHDLVTGTYVVDAAHEGDVEVGPIWRWHWLILAGLAVALTAGVEWFAHVSAARLGGMTEDLREVENLQDVDRASMQEVWSRNSGEPGRRTLDVEVVTGAAPAEDGRVADEVAALLLRSDPKVTAYDVLRIRVTRGYDIGVASSWKSESFERSPVDWSDRVQ